MKKIFMVLIFCFGMMFAVNGAEQAHAYSIESYCWDLYYDVDGDLWATCPDYVYGGHTTDWIDDDPCYDVYADSAGNLQCSYY